MGRGEEVPHTISFQDPSFLHKLFTERRLNLLQSVMADSLDSIRALADRLNRGVSEVHDNVHVLNDHGILYFENGPGRRKRRRVPYERIQIELELGRVEREVSVSFTKEELVAIANEVGYTVEEGSRPSTTLVFY